jgi:membrane protein implicated in regulation of membrane protease activity
MVGTSKGFQLDKNDIWPILFRALMVGLAAALAFLTEKAAHLDLGELTVFLVPVVTALLAAITRWLHDFNKDNKEEKKEKEENENGVFNKV